MWRGKDVRAGDEVSPQSTTADVASMHGASLPRPFAAWR
jgi:hypothetical protein